MKLKTIRLYGKLGAKFGRVHRLAVANAAEAVRALSVMLPGFESHMSNAPGGYAVFYGRENISQERLGHPAGKDDIRIAPIPAGAKQGGLFQVIVGIVLIVAGAVTGQPALMMAGAAMAIGGAVMMLSPQPSAAESADSANNRSSYAFNGPVNTEAQGNPVPLLYGELIVGSAVISGGVYVEDRA
ncbi:MAG: tail assembly protein [Pseudomonas stutzeri]|nr:tail assembly protein [Stutzerimonas stutzeri]